MLVLDWLLGAQLLVWPLLPATSALTPQTVTPAFPALTGAETSDDWSPEPLDELVLVVLL